MYQTPSIVHSFTRIDFAPADSTSLVAHVIFVMIVILKVFLTHASIRSLDQENRNKGKQLTIDTLWNEVRNKIAQHNHIPTFNETNDAIKILISFMKEMPMTLHNWDSSLHLN